MGNSAAVVGLGAMGLPMAAHLAESGPVRGSDPVEERRRLAHREGVLVQATPSDAVEGADWIIVAARDATQVHEALFAPTGIAAGATPGATVVLTSTIGPAESAALSLKVQSRGLHFLDAPVSGGPARARNGDLIAFVGGSSRLALPASELLSKLASIVHVAGPEAGDGQTLKVINQLLAGAHIAAAAEAITLARTAGLEPARVIQALQAGAASSFMLGDRGPRMVTAHGDRAKVRSRVDIFVKDMGLVAELARQLHVATPVAAAAAQLFQLAETAGLGAYDDSSVVTLLSPVASRESV